MIRIRPENDTKDPFETISHSENAAFQKNMYIYIYIKCTLKTLRIYEENIDARGCRWVGKPETPGPKPSMLLGSCRNSHIRAGSFGPKQVSWRWTLERLKLSGSYLAVKVSGPYLCLVAEV